MQTIIDTKKIKRETDLKCIELQKDERRLIKAITNLESRKIGAETKLQELEGRRKALMEAFKKSIVNEEGAAVAIETEIKGVDKEVELFNVTLEALKEKIISESQLLETNRSQQCENKINALRADVVECCRNYNRVALELARCSKGISEKIHELGGEAMVSDLIQLGFTYGVNNVGLALAANIYRIFIKSEGEAFTGGELPYFWNSLADPPSAKFFNAGLKNYQNPYLSEGV